MKTCIYWLKTDQERGRTEERLSRAVAKYLDICPTSPRLAVSRDGRGRPGLPLLPGVFSSVSHSGGIWLCALAGRPVGVDLQAARPCPREQIAERFFHPQELVYLKAQDFEDFFKIWTAKESFVKLTGRGMFPGFGDFSAVSQGEISSRISGVRLAFPEFLPGFLLCVAGGDGEIELYELNEM